MRDKVFYSICFGFIFGVLLRSLVYINFYTVVFVGAIGLALFLIYSTTSKSKITLILGVFLIAFGFGALRFHLVDKSAPQVFESKVGQAVTFSGILVDEPNVGEKNQKLDIKVAEGNEKTEVLVTTNFGENFKYGDAVKVSGVLEKPENFKTDSGKMFDYVNYLRKDGILYIMGYPDVEILSHGNGSKIKSALFAVKNKFCCTEPREPAYGRADLRRKIGLWCRST